MITTYMPLYRRYRPQAFADLVGQAPIAQALTNAIAMDRVAHAYLFCGPRGTGKTSTARILAKSLNCAQGPSASPCQTCPSCQGVFNGTALDVIEFDAASNNGVQDARELIESCQFAPIAGRYKIYIIDEVHMLTPQAFNALLKTLEEPPANVVFIFATTEAHKVLPTIVSRCQRFDFNRITSADICQRLEAIAQAEQIAIAPEALRVIARHARGGMRDAVGLLDQVSVFASDVPLDVADVLRLTGTLEEDVVLALGHALASQMPAELLQHLGTLQARGIEPAQLVKTLTEHLRCLMLLKALGVTEDSPEALFRRHPQLQERLEAISQDKWPSYVAQAARFEAAELPQMLMQLADLDRTMRTTQHPALWLEVGMMGLLYRQEQASSSDGGQIEARIAALEAGLHQLQRRHGETQNFPYSAPGGLPLTGRSTAPSPPASGSSSQPPASPAPPTPAVAVSLPASPSGNTSHNLNLDALWQQLLRQVASMSVRALLQQHGHLIHWDVGAQAASIGCTTSQIADMLRQPARRLHLEKAAQQVMGTSAVTLDIVQNKPGPAPAAASGLVLPPLMAETPAVADNHGIERRETDIVPQALPPQNPSPMPPNTPVSPLPAAEAVAATGAPETENTTPLPASPVPDGEAEAWAQSRAFAITLLKGKVLPDAQDA